MIISNAFTVAFLVAVRRSSKSVFLFLMGVFAAAFLTACASSSDKPKPAELSVNVPKLGIRMAWSNRIGAVNFPLDVKISALSTNAIINSASNASIFIANSDGQIISIDATTGRESWRARAGKSIAAGVGGLNSQAAVVTESNELIVFDSGKEVWRQKLSTSSFTAPLIADQKVFVLGSDRSIAAFDGTTGRKLWTQKRGAEALTLRQSGVLLMSSDTLITSSAGRLQGLNPLDGSVRWDTPIAVARGTNDVERLVDLVGRVSNLSDVVCARAYRVSIGCVNIFRGKLLWTKPAIGFEGLQGDETSVFSTESDGKIIAWDNSNGEKLWVSDTLVNRTLSAPAVLPKALVVGDSTGIIHFLSKTDGSALNRLPTDGSALAAAPVVIGKTLVVVTRNGGVFGFVAE